MEQDLDEEDLADCRERKRLFLAELAVLREQYGIEIGGCGECGSPWLYDTRTEQDLGWHLGWCEDGYILQQGET